MRKLLASPIPIAPLVVFRVLFGFIMAVSVLRFALKGWIDALYVRPTYHFTFYGFDWVAPLGEGGMYALYGVMGLAALGIMLGWRYRIAVAVFFLAFTYVELIDKANYLNHYYFVSVVSFLLFWVPAHRAFSLDVRRKPALKVDTVPLWTTGVFKLQLGLVYVYAGLAKLHPDWLLDAMPLRLWLPAHTHLPLVGPLLGEPLTAYLFSWAGAVYDLTIVFFLLWRRTRPVAYVAVVAFHLMTALLFQIGMFPYIMILSTLIYFSPQFYEAVLARAKAAWRAVAHRRGAPARAQRGRHARKGILRALPVPPRRHPREGGDPGKDRQRGLDSRLRGNDEVKRGERKTNAYPCEPARESASRPPVPFRLGRRASVALAVLFAVHFALQVIVPLRAFAYPGHLFWTEQGYRFSWRVMLMEKAGYAVFRVYDPATGRRWEASNYEHLTPNQEKMMATQPDMILQFAHHLEDVYRQAGIDDVEVTVAAHVTLNGRRSRLLVDPDVDLTNVERGFRHKDWVLPFDDHEPRWASRR